MSSWQLQIASTVHGSRPFPLGGGDAMREIRDRITTSVRFNTVVETGVPGFIPRDPMN
jgi:hypothetical protein